MNTMLRKLPKVSAFVIGVVWLVSNSSFAQIQVALPIDFYSERNISVPVSVGDVSGHEIWAFLFTLSYDASVFEISGVEASGDMAEDFALVINSNTPGVVTISGAHHEPLQGEGTLFHIQGRFVSRGITDLVFNSFTFNEGQPLAATRNGQISNSVPINNEDEFLLPEDFTLNGNYPNPFNPTTSIKFDLPESAQVTINIVDMLGRVVMNVPSQRFEAGSGHMIQVDATSLASGIYVYQVVAEGAQQTYQKAATMTLIK